MRQIPFPLWPALLVALLGQVLAAPELKVAYPDRVSVFGRAQLTLELPDELAAFEQLADTQVHDFYDADRDGVYVQVRAEVRHDDGEVIEYPGFAMRDAPGGPWRYRVRFSPTRPGHWHVTVGFMGRARADQGAVFLAAKLPTTIVAVDSKLAGHLLPPNPDAPRYLRQRQPDGLSRAMWLFGASRAWVAQSRDTRGEGWAANEWVDMPREVLAPMRAYGYNFLVQWMAPWEYLLVHQDRAEWWRGANGAWRRHQRSPKTAWTSYQCIDQGRAFAFDQLLAQCEGDERHPTIYLMLSPLPRHALQTKDHPWSGASSWSAETANDPRPEKLNGFSTFRGGLDIWEFFQAAPDQPPDDWRSQLFDHQANFYTYLIARWGYSRSIGVWAPIDEPDAVGDQAASLAARRGWWGHPECEAWLGNVVRLFRGDLHRQDAVPYLGDPLRRPLHSATTGYEGTPGSGGNLSWRGGTPRIDLLGWHWYPWWREGTEHAAIWNLIVVGLGNYATTHIGEMPRLVSEFGSPDRSQPGDPVSELYPSLYHFALWTSVIAGHSGAAIDWDDGKQFGELHGRERDGIFHRRTYPIGKVEQMAALRKFLKGQSPDELGPCLASDARIRVAGQGAVKCFALHSREAPDRLYGWLFSPTDEGEFSIRPLKPGNYVLIWYDPWTGQPIPELQPLPVTVGADGAADLDAGPILKLIRERSAPFPAESRQAKGRDVAFQLLPK